MYHNFACMFTFLNFFHVFLLKCMKLTATVLFIQLSYQVRTVFCLLRCIYSIKTAFVWVYCLRMQCCTGKLPGNLPEKMGLASCQASSRQVTFFCLIYLFLSNRCHYFTKFNLNHANFGYFLYISPSKMH